MRRGALLLLAVLALGLTGCRVFVDGTPWGQVDARAGGTGANPCDGASCPAPAAKAP